jgi:hypothetical protein
MTDSKTQADIDKLAGVLELIASDLLNGKGFAIPIFDVMGAVNAGKRLAGKNNAGKQVFKQFFSHLANEHPEVIDFAFASMSEAAKNKIRKMAGGPEIKDAERV